MNANKNSVGQENRDIMKDEDEDIKYKIMEEAYEISKILEEQLKSVLEPMDNA